MPFPGAGFTFEFGQFQLLEVQEFSISAPPDSDTGTFSRTGDRVGIDGRVVRLVSLQPAFPSDFQLGKNIIGSQSSALSPYASLNISCANLSLDDRRVRGAVVRTPVPFSEKVFLVSHEARYEGFTCDARAGGVLRFIHSFTLISRSFQQINIIGA